jgi:E3 Ubiquitin ligase
VNLQMVEPLLALLVFAGPPNWLFWPIIGAFAGVYFFYQGFQLLQRKRLILNIPSSKVRSASMGLVELNGQAVGPYTLTAPITGEACYYLRTKVWQWKQQGKNSSWEQVVDESLHLPFYLEDNTGRVLVNPQGAEMEVERNFQDEFSQSPFSSRLPIPANISSFLALHGVSSGQKIKVEEYCIRPKNSLFILGTLAENSGLEVTAVPVRSTPSEQPSFSWRMPLSFGGSAFASGTISANFTRTTLERDVSQDFGTVSHQTTGSTKQADQKELAAILTEAGVTSPAAWAAAGISNPANAVTAAAPTTAFDLHPHVVLMKGKHNPAFFISWRSQREVVKSLGRKSTLMIWGGPALTLVCTYIVAAQLGWL